MKIEILKLKFRYYIFFKIQNNCLHLNLIRILKLDIIFI